MTVFGWSCIAQHIVFSITYSFECDFFKLPVQYHSMYTYYVGHSVSVDSTLPTISVLPVLMLMVLCNYCNTIYDLLLDLCDKCHTTRMSHYHYRLSGKFEKKGKKNKILTKMDWISWFLNIYSDKPFFFFFLFSPYL